MTWRRQSVPLLITLVAAALRFHQFVDLPFDYDSSYPLAQAIAGWQIGRWPALGQDTSILFSNPPGMAYVVLLPWLAFQSVWGVYAVIIGLNLLAVPLTYAVVRRVGTPAQANAAALLAAANPWTIEFSARGWVQGLLPFWTTLVFALLALALFTSGSSRARSVRLVAALAALAALTNMYLLALFSLAPVGLILALNHRRVAWRGALAGFAVLGVLLGSYAWQLAAQWPVQSARLPRLAEAATAAPAEQSALTALEHGARLVTGRDYEIAYGRDDSLGWIVRRRVALVMSSALALALALGVVRAVVRVVRRLPDGPFWLATLIWWLLPIAAFTPVRQPVHIAYLLVSLPAGFVLAAPLLAPFLRSWIGVLLAGALVANSFGLLRASHRETLLRPAGRGIAGLSLRALVPFQRAAVPIVDRYGLAEVYAPEPWSVLTAATGRALVTVPVPQLSTFQIFRIDRPALYVRLEHGRIADSLPLADRAALVEYRGGDTVVFDLVPAQPRAQLVSLGSAPVEWPSAEGLTLVGYDLSASGDAVTVLWAVDSLVPGREQWLYGPYAHLTDAQGRLVANVGAQGPAGYDYRLGDVYRVHLVWPVVPAGDYELELGLFDGVHVRGITMLPPGQTPRPVYTAHITLPPKTPSRK